MSEMKNLTRVIAMYIAGAFCIPAHGQEYLEPEWKFHLAFEDATGARDTMWIMLDSQIPVGNDFLNMEFGEVPYTLNESVFNVFTGLTLTEVTKVRAYNLEMSFEFYIDAINFVYPLTLSWDSALFLSPLLADTEAGYIYQPRLDNDYFFNYHDEVGMYHMIYASQVEMPEFWHWSASHFPLAVYFSRGFWSWGPPGTRNMKGVQDLRLYPNPAADVVHIDCGPNSTPLRSVDVFALDGRHLLSDGVFGTADDGIYGVNVSGLPPGMYALYTVAVDGSRGSGRFVVSR